jgi:hypothetical protein
MADKRRPLLRRQVHPQQALQRRPLLHPLHNPRPCQPQPQHDLPRPPPLQHHPRLRVYVPEHTHSSWLACMVCLPIRATPTASNTRQQTDCHLNIACAEREAIRNRAMRALTFCSHRCRSTLAPRGPGCRTRLSGSLWGGLRRGCMGRSAVVEHNTHSHTPHTKHDGDTQTKHI